MSADIAKAKGTAMPTYPKYSSGGWTAIRMWFWRSGLGPRPSSAASESANGQLLASKHPTLPGSMHTRNGSETVSITVKKNSVMMPSTTIAPAPRASPAGRFTIWR